MVSPSTQLPEELQFRNVASAMKQMLIVTAVLLLALISVIAWLSMKVFPEMRALKADALAQQEKANSALAQVSDSCIELATIMSNPPNDNYERATKTLDKCAVVFPKDPVFPAYKAEVMTRWFQGDKTQPIHLEYALQSATTSFAISQSLNQKPNDLAFQAQGLAYCLLAQYGPTASRGLNAANATTSLRKALESSPHLEPWIKGSEDVKSACPQSVRDAFK